MATLLSICQEAIEGIPGFATPSTIIGNSLPDAVLLRRCATQVGREIERKYKLQALKREHTFDTVNGTSAYALPSSYRRFANLTFWDRDNEWPLRGPVSDKNWQELKSGLVIVSGINFHYQVYNNYFNIAPTPTDAYTIAYNYYSKQFCETSGGTGLDDWAADTDVSRIDESIMVLGVKYRFRAARRLPYDEEKADYLDALKDLVADDTPKALIDLTGVRTVVTNPGIPDTGYGA